MIFNFRRKLIITYVGCAICTECTFGSATFCVCRNNIIYKIRRTRPATVITNETKPITIYSSIIIIIYHSKLTTPLQIKIITIQTTTISTIMINLILIEHGLYILLNVSTLLAVTSNIVVIEQ